MNEQIFLLSLAQQLDAFPVVRYHHVGEYLVRFPLRLDLVIAAALARFFFVEELCLDSELRIQLAALL